MTQTYKTLKFAVIGDVHGHFELFAGILNSLKEQENIQFAFQLGDLGFISSDEKDYLQLLISGDVNNKPFLYEGFDNINEALAFLNGDIELPLPVFFVGGNHEDWPFLEKLQKEANEREQKSPYFVAPNLYFLGRSGITEIMGIQVGYLSGICRNSIYTDDFSSFSSYLIREEDLQKLFAQKAIPNLFLFHESVRCNLVKQVIEHFSPRYSFHGHMHFFEKGEHGTTKYFQLEMCSPSEFNNCIIICNFDGREICSVYLKNFFELYF